MTSNYKLVQWNRHKKVYDIVLLGAVLGYLLTFFIATTIAHPTPRDISIPVVAIRALATLAFILLHIILCIGPLARLTNRPAPLLYNRRHLGVTFFVVAFAHAALATAYYGGFGVRNPMAATLDGYHSFASISGFPFEVLGLLALIIFFVMAATSHDFWLANLSPRLWKSLHMLVYLAYGLVVLHVGFGALQSERSPIFAIALLLGVLTVATLHIVAGLKERRPGRRAAQPTTNWLDVGSIDEIQDNAAKVVCLKDRERIAVFKYDGKVSAVSNVCAHQNGPLGEGRIVNGCITCPWHGYQYLPEKGQSPPPYTETIPTYNVRLEGKRILINPHPNPPGTPVTPAIIEATAL
ncbi:MAG: ferric reductase-like transmembrane domain-containing protein [Phycisphaerales bacterium]|nr:ferric reductase-like transmembrane domain-containing protein [Phycisphaerales bacterium]